MCERERDVLQALSAGRWPSGCDPELRDHVAACASCCDLVEVATALIADRAEAIRHAQVPGSGLAWWRMQMRVRREAARTASRALTAMQATALACALAVAVVILGSRVDVTSLAPAVPWGIPLVLALGAWLTLAPLAVYLTVTEK